MINNADLLIFPGGGSPESLLYRKVYELLKIEARANGYETISLLCWPGHSYKGGCFDSELTMEGALRVATKRILEQEKLGREYHLLGRSFGTIIAVASIQDIETPNLKKLILWGPPPFWLLWKLFVKDLEKYREVALDKGLNISKNFFSSVIPFETLVENIEVDTIVATGTGDPYSTPAFLNYLKAICSNNQQIQFKLVENCKHEVTEDDSNWKEYVEALLG
jgi:alpha-beta hydrolase superfamily lysophospholipase